jgi:hypothetical protein
MSDLLELQVQLQDTNAMIARLEGDLAKHPDLPSVYINLTSLKKRRDNLAEQFLEASALKGLEVCSYRIVPADHRQPKLAGVAAALGDYQNALTVFFGAMKKDSPMQTTKVGAEATEESALDFAFAFAGSVGFVFTIPNERLLLIGTDLDDAVHVMFQVAKAKEPGEILEHAKQLGPAPIRSLYRWANGHVKAGFSADIEWRRGHEVKEQLLVQKPELEQLCQAIDASSEETSTELLLTGRLVGVDVGNQTFHFEPDAGGQGLRGKLSGVVGDSHPAEVPKRYEAKIVKTVKVYYSTEQEDVSYELVSLNPV